MGQSGGLWAVGNVGADHIGDGRGSLLSGGRRSTVDWSRWDGRGTAAGAVDGSSWSGRGGLVGWSSWDSRAALSAVASGSVGLEGGVGGASKSGEGGDLVLHCELRVVVRY